MTDLPEILEESVAEDAPSTPEEWRQLESHRSFERVRQGIRVTTAMVFTMGRELWKIRRYELWREQDMPSEEAALAQPDVALGKDTADKYVGMFKDFVVSNVARRNGYDATEALERRAVEMDRDEASGALLPVVDEVSEFEGQVDAALSDAIDEVGDVEYSKLDLIRQFVRHPDVGGQTYEWWVEQARSHSRSDLKRIIREHQGTGDDAAHQWMDEIDEVKSLVRKVDKSLAEAQLGKAADALGDVAGKAERFADELRALASDDGDAEAGAALDGRAGDEAPPEGEDDVAARVERLASDYDQGTLLEVVEGRGVYLGPEPSASELAERIVQEGWERDLETS